MKCRNYALILSALLSVSLSLSAQASPSAAAPAPGSTPTSPPPAGLWQALHGQMPLLLPAFDSFTANLTEQISSLRSSNLSLQQSNRSLTISNASLMESLRQSQAQAATSELKSRELQTDLNDSTASITRATTEAHALELRLSIWKGLGITFGAGLGAIAVYEGGHAAHWW